MAEGAAYYGLVRMGEGTRVGAGSPRSYLCGGWGRKGRGWKKKAVCLVPRGTEEGFTEELAQPAFQVLTNRPVSFQIFSSSTRLGDRMGDVVRLEEDEATPLPPLRTVLALWEKGSRPAPPDPAPGPPDGDRDPGTLVSGQADTPSLAAPIRYPPGRRASGDFSR